MIYWSAGYSEFISDKYVKALKKFLHIYSELNISNKHLYNIIGLTYLNLGAHNEALDFFFNNIDKCESSNDQEYLAITYNNIAISLTNMNKLDKALNYYSKALLLRKQIYDSLHPNIGESYYNMAKIYYKIRVFDSAHIFNEIAIKILELDSIPSIAKMNDILKLQGNIELVKGKKLSAAKYYKSIIHNIDSLNDTLNPIRISALTNLGIAYSDSSFQVSYFYFKSAIKYAEKIRGDKSIDIVNQYWNFGVFCNKYGSYFEAIKYLQKAENIILYEFGPGYYQLAYLYEQMSTSYLQLKNKDLAIDFLLKSIEIYSQFLPLDSEKLIALKNKLENINNSILSQP